MSFQNNMKDLKEHDKWNLYGIGRNVARNRLTMVHHQGVINTFIWWFAQQDVNLKVLDIGCASGFFLEILRNLGFENIQGMDMSPHYVELATSKNLNVCLGNIYEINDEGEWDIIICMEIFEHLPEIPFNILNRALTPGGKLFVTIPVYDSIAEKFERKFKGISKLEQAMRQDETHIRALDLNILVNEAQKAGFVLELSKHLWNPIPFRRYKIIWRIIWKMISGFSNAGTHLVCVFRKES